MAAECEMMAAQDNGEYADCWTWGRCIIGNLSDDANLLFHYGGPADQPDDGLGNFGVTTDEAVH